MNKIIVSLVGIALIVAPTFAFAKGASFSGGRSFSGSRSFSAPRVSSPIKSVTPSKSVTSTKSAVPDAPKVSAKPSPLTQTKVAGTAPKSTTGKVMAKKGSVVDSTYQPRFRGYAATPGSTVYYQDNSWMMWIPLMYLMNNNSHREAVVVSPTGSSTTVHEEGVDTMYVWNWIFTILLGLGLIGLLVWYVNKRSKLNKSKDSKENE